MTPKGHERKSLGQRGEELAASVLKRAGYRILERNYQCPLGELDLVARQGGILVFVEVKSGEGSDGIPPRERVNWRKQKKLFHVAQFYLKEKRLQGVSARFDVVEVSFLAGNPPTAQIIPNAFETPDR
jgi:putative endonuclease